MGALTLCVADELPSTKYRAATEADLTDDVLLRILKTLKAAMDRRLWTDVPYLLSVRASNILLREKAVTVQDVRVLYAKVCEWDTIAGVGAMVKRELATLLKEADGSR